MGNVDNVSSKIRGAIVEELIQDKTCYKKTMSGLKNYLRTFALIVSAHPYCARNPLRDVMPRHALSARAVEEMWRYIALVGTLISMHGFNSLKCSVTPYFLLIDQFLCEKLKKVHVVEV